MNSIPIVICQLASLNLKGRSNVLSSQPCSCCVPRGDNSLKHRSQEYRDKSYYWSYYPGGLNPVRLKDGPLWSLDEQDMNQPEARWASEPDSVPGGRPLSTDFEYYITAREKTLRSSQRTSNVESGGGDYLPSSSVTGDSLVGGSCDGNASDCHMTF